MDRDLIAAPLPLDSERAEHIGSPDLPVFRRFGQRRVPPGRVLLPEGRRPHSLVVVISGAMSLTVTARDGRRAIVGLLGPGDVHGEPGLHRSASDRIDPEVRTLSTTTLIWFSPHELHRAMVEDPSFGLWLIQALGRMVHDLQTRLAVTLALGVRDRSLAILQTLAGRWGRPSPMGRVIDLPLSQEALAAMVGVSRESVNRALRDLRREGLVLRWGRRYVLPSREPERSGRQAAGPSPPHLPAPA
jgi:CRP/FNR family transcriptional regulator, cyclic AMP receptor protein